MKTWLHAVVLPLCRYMYERNIHFMIEWIPREQNERADALSKEVNSADWKLNPTIFKELDRAWGPFRTDLFASHHNAQLPRFFSWHHCPGSAGVDAFTQLWGRLEWCNPPFGLIGRALQHAIACKASMCMIAPFWPNARWWHSLVESTSTFRPFVHACKVLGKSRDMFLGAAQGSTRPVAKVQWQTMALFIDCTQDFSLASSIPLSRP